ncbi:tail protein (partial) of prophage CP-933X [Escherichia coli]|nr:tail protein (partial) of prophage CP-933X [Escherichia coli]
MDFTLGSQGLRHTPGDIIEICDNDYAGTMTGGRVLSIDAATRTLTLDREVTLPETGAATVNLINGSGKPVSVDITAHPAPDRIQVSTLPDGVETYGVWGLSLPSLRRRLFRCVSIRENTEGTFAITAVQHVPEKEAIVDNGASFEPQSGSLNSVIPPAVQHLTVEVSAADGQYLAQAKWDTPRVVKGVRFSLRLTNGSGEDSRLVTTAITADTEHRFSGLPLGEYTLTVRAINSYGQQGEPATTTFRINAPAVPATIELTPGYFQITAVPRLAVYDPTVQFEFWFSETRITDIRQVETTARYLGTGLYWIAASINIKPGHDYYFYIRSVNTVGKSAFVEAVGQPSDDASGYLDFFKGEIGKTHLAQELWTQIDNGQLAPDLTEIRTSITDVSNEITQTVNKKLEDQSAAIQQIQKVQVDTNNNLNSMWAVKLQQMQDGRLYIAGIGAGIENTPDGMQSQVLLAADRIAMINPANGNTKPMFVGQGDQIFMNEVFLKYLTAPTITSGGNPPAFSLTPDGRLTAKNATLPETGTSAVNLINGSGKPVSVDITAHPAPDRIQVSTLPDGVETYGVWGLSLPSLRRRLFRCVSIRENTDGTFAITAVQHVPEKEAIVDNGARFEPQSGSLNSVIPPAVQHLTVEVSAADGRYLAQAKWDTPRVVKGVRFSLRLTSGSGQDSRLVTTAITADTEHRFSGLPPGEYTLTVRAINSYGQQGEPATTTFRINAPAVPATIELTPGYFQITAVPRLAVYDPTVQFEFWFSETKIADTSQVETSARYLGTGSQWSVSGPHIKPGKDFWFYVRSVNLVGKSAFVEASGRASNDAEGYLGLFREKIGKLHLAQGLWELIDNSQLADEMAEMKTTITETRNEITQTVSKTLEDQSATIQQIQRVQKDTNDDLAALYMLKVQKTKNGIPYVAGIGAGIEDTDGQPLSNILLLADRIAMINPEDGNTTPLSSTTTSLLVYGHTTSDGRS